MGEEDGGRAGGKKVGKCRSETKVDKDSTPSSGKSARSFKVSYAPRTYLKEDLIIP